VAPTWRAGACNAIEGGYESRVVVASDPERTSGRSAEGGKRNLCRKRAPSVRLSGLLRRALFNARAGQDVG
jgi:hypothetical protein